MRRSICSVSVLLLSLCAGSALAYGYESEEFDVARVVSVDPILETVSEPVSRDVCWNEPVEVYEPEYRYESRRHRDNTGATVLGAIIGGALGNTVGRGDGRRAATIAGAVIGGAIANDNARRPRYRDVGGRYVTREERRCDVRTEYQSDERVVGYDVGYEYNGRVYHTRTDHHPGDSIRVRVQVAAID